MENEFKVFVEEVEYDADYNLYVGRRNSLNISYICSCQSQRDAMEVREALEFWYNTPDPKESE